MKEPLSREVRVKNRLGLHARAASQIVKMASRYSSDIFIIKDGLKVNAKSIMGILMLAAAEGSSLTLQAEGKDAKKALVSLAKLVEEDKFYEE